MKSIKKFIPLLIFIILFIGCGGGGGSGNSSSSANVSSNTSGVAQKGPFIQGSKVTAYKLNSGERSNTEKISTTTNDNKGNFSITVPWAGPTEYEISGEYLDENTGTYLSDGKLSAVVNTQANTSSNININIFTHIATAHIKHMLKNSMNIDEAKEESRNKIKEMFNLELEGDTKLEDLDLTDGLGDHKSDNAQLLKISAALLSSNNPDTSLEKLTELISSSGNLNTDVINVYYDILQKADEVDLTNINNILKNTIEASNPPNTNTREGNLPFNHGLAFDTKVDVDINKTLISNYIVINNLNGVAKLSIENGTYSLNDEEFAGTEITVKNSDTIRVKHYALNSYGSENITTLNIGVTRVTFKSITKADPTSNITSPNSFSFPVKINAPLGGSIISDEIVLSGLSEGVLSKVGVSSGASYKINDSDWKTNTYEDTLSFSSARNGDIIKVSNTASYSYGGKSEATLRIGEVSGVFTIFSKQKDIRAELFFPETIYEVDLNTIYETPYYTMSGYEGGLDIKVTNGEVQLSGESVWLSELSQVPAGYKVKFRQTSSSEYRTSNKTVIKFGRSVVDFETITISDPSIRSAVPNDIKFKTKFDADLESFIESEERIITGMNGSASYAYISNGDFVSINGQEWTSEPVLITLGTKIKVRVKTNLSYNSQNYATLYHGPAKKLFARFSVYNKKQDTSIDDIDFSNKEDVKIDTYYESDIVTITGINYAAGTYIINGEFKINSGEWKTSSQKIYLHNNDTLQVRHKSSTNANESVHTIVSSDTKQFEFKTTTSSFPVFLNKPKSTVNQNSNYLFIPNIKDIHTLSFSLISNPSWMNINPSTGKITGIPRQEDVGQTDTISLLVKSTSGLEKSIDFKVTVIDVNDAPILSDTWTSDTADDLNFYIRSASAIDIEGGSLTWFISNNPAWLNINENTGELSGKPTQADIGLQENIRVMVREEDLAFSYFEFNLRVIDKNNYPILVSISDKTINDNEEFIFKAEGSDADGDTLNYGIQNKPNWAIFNNSTGTLNGTPTKSDVGVYENITISLSDGNGSTRFESFKITVVHLNKIPTILSNDFTKEFILDDTSSTPNNYTFVFDIADRDNEWSQLDVIQASVISETRVGFGKTTNFTNNTLDCIKGRCVANISFSFQDIDNFHPSLKTRHTFTVSDGDKSASNYIDIWYAPTKPVLSGETSHTIEVKDKISYEIFSFIPTNSANKARTWAIKNKPDGFEFDTSTGEITYSPISKGLLLKDTLFKGMEVTATNDRGVSNKFIFSILVKGKPQFEFVDKEGVEIQQWFDSSITVDWLEVNEEVSISSSGYVGQTVHSGYTVNGQQNITQIKNGDKITAWHKSSNEYDTTLNTTITIGNDSDTFSTKTKLSGSTKLPLIVGAPNTRANVNELYTYTPQLSTDYTQFAPVTNGFSIENRPSWASFDADTGTLSGTPIKIETHNQVRITAFGDNGLDDITFNISVSNDAPYINGFGHSLENTDLSFTFDDNSDWRTNINKVSMYACYDQSEAVLLNASDYTFTQGSLKLHSSTSTNPILHIPIMGGGRLIVESDGYANSESLIDMVEDGQYAVKVNILEENGKIKLSLTNHLEFSDNILDISNFILYEAPTGTVIKSVEYIDSTNAILELGHAGIINQETLNIKISINNSELNICQNIVSNNIILSKLEEVSKNIIKTGVTDTLVNEDDAFYKKGQDRSYAYTDNIDYHTVHTNVVLDNNTGLQWQNNKLVTIDDYGSLIGDENWDKAVKYCEDLTLDTYDDWRLPSIDELLTLVDYSKQDNMLDEIFNYLGHVVGYPEYYNYWSSTSYSSDNSYAWNIDLKDGEHHYHGKISSDNVMCVRGNTQKEGSFTRSLEGIVKDFSTNLLWQDNEIYHSISIDDAITYCQNLTLDNNSNWRVPNINELKSILNHDNTPLNISDIFENTSTAFYYSSTQSSIDNNKYWLVNFESGGTDGSHSQSNYKTRCVSGNNIASTPIVEVKILDNTDSDADDDHITLGIELKGTTFSGQNLSLMRLNRAPDKDVQASVGFVYVDETHAYIIENMENISEDITVSFTIHNTEINYDENITSNSIIIKKPVTAPVANAGVDQIVVENEAIRFDASLSSDDDTIVSYEWKVGETILSTNSIFLKSNFSLGEHDIQLTVIDNDGLESIDNIIVSVYDIIHNGYGYNIVTSPIDSSQWLDRNLGAKKVCTKQRSDVEFTTNEEYIQSQKECFGDLYQWGRSTDGHEKRNSLTTDILATDIFNTNEFFITTEVADKDWTDNIDTDAKLRQAEWLKVDGTSICPTDFRVPLPIDFSYTDTNVDFLNIPYSGLRIRDASISYEGILGKLFSASVSTYLYHVLGIGYGPSGLNTYSIIDFDEGASIRCIKD